MANSRVVVLGDANVDMRVQLPQRTKNEALDQQYPAPELHGGGTSANVAVGLARLGVPVSFVGAIGADNYGRWVRDDLVNENVDVLGVRMIEDEFTVMVMALIQPDGERLIYVWPPKGGAHLHIREEDINLSDWPEAHWLHTSGILLRGNPARETILNTMAQARQLGWKVSIDLNLRTESWGLDDEARQTFQQAIELSDVVFGNAEEELMPLSGEATIKNAAQALCNNQRTIIARLGEEGALVCTPDKIFHSPAFDAEIVDTIGAGDAFNAGFITAQLSGHDNVEATRWGNAVAALKIERPGARGGPNLEALRRKLS
ncbi:MAG: sugar kinase [Chloroflexi bacterium]|nr:MAG: sugar kinase [Chloroflexota bacterium]MBL1193422.1 sugar kinase [Chloroflexota bacterium]NOH10714.1 sugar kinase [Chloroflexota bacterium]